jgi:ribulose-5-phosphate 4-epimerase/fuculose-1-phosphate aldolase
MGGNLWKERPRWCAGGLRMTFLIVAAFLALAGSTYAQSSAYTLNPKTADEAIDQLIWANRILANEGIFDFLGHISVRNPENDKTFFIARGIAPETVTRQDILEVDMEGKVLTKNPLGRPYSERVIHGGIYKVRPDVKSVIHAHPAVVVAFSVSELPFRIVAHPASIFYEGIPSFDAYDFSPKGNGMLIRSNEEGDLIAKTLGPKALAMWMKGHGYNVVGASIPNSVRAAIELRDNLNILMTASQFGKITWSLEGEAAKHAAASISPPERPWGAWLSRVKKNMPDMK